MKPEINYKAANVRDALNRLESLDDKIQVVSDLMIECIFDQADGKKLHAANAFIERFGRDFNEAYARHLGFEKKGELVA